MTANGERLSHVADRRQRRSTDDLRPHLATPARGLVSCLIRMITFFAYLLVRNMARGVPKGYKGICTPRKKLRKFDLAIAAEDVANLANVNMWL